VSCSGECCRSARGSDYYGRTRASNPVCDSEDVTFYETSQLPQFVFSRWIMMQEFIREADGSQREAERVPYVAAVRYRKLAASTPKVDQQNSRDIYPEPRQDSEMDQPAFL
jgi:hypothetical protein